MTRIARSIGLSLALVRSHARAYAWINVAYYGLVVLFMGVAALVPALQDEVLRSTKESLAHGMGRTVKEAYEQGRMLEAIALTFAVNLLVGSLAYMTLPSLIVPFVGLASGAVRAALWGALFSPVHSTMGLGLLPHLLTLLLEGQAYVLTMLAVWLQGRAFLFPQSVGAAGRWQGFREGLRRTGRIYLLVTPLLLVSAIYEAIEVIAMRP